MESGDFSPNSPIIKRGIIWFSWKLGRTLTETHNEMVNAYGVDAPVLSTVHYWFSRFENGVEQFGDKHRDGRPKDHEAVDIVKKMMDEDDYASARSIALATGRALGTILNVLHEDLGMKYFLKNWVPHTLSGEQKDARVKGAKTLLAELQRVTSRGLAYIVTEDESWFSHYNPHQAKWARTRSEAGSRSRQKPTKEKTLVVVFWSFSGFFLVRALPSGSTFTSEYFVTSLLPDIESEISKTRPSLRLARTKLHWDNARPHTSSTTRYALDSKGVILLQTPPYSPDLSPSDFFLFGYLKGLMKGVQFTGSDEIVERVSEILGELRKDQLLKVFEEWKHRLAWVVENGGEYYTK
jgi:histone-lysine N-methyltransferase SETMAR